MCIRDSLNAARSPAHQRLVCEEFLSLQTVLQLQRAQGKSELLGPEMILDEASVAAILKVLPFRLTPGQEAALSTILADMQSRVPMHRLLQGDVGCGKTAVAGGALLVAATAGYQAAIMVPTELLARQHLRWLAPWAAAGGVHMECLTGTTSSGSKQQILDGLANGDIRLLVGTHALLEPEVLFSKLGLAVIDEQHRFGVRQRALLREKGRADHHQCPHLLVMTATPIPRTLALTVYGDLEVSNIRELPPGRRPILTTARSEAARPDVYKLMSDEIAKGRQVYFVCPLVDESEKLDFKAATEMFQELKIRVFPKLSLIHI